MVSRWPFYLVVGILLAIGTSMMAYHHVALEVPWSPGEQRPVWEVEAQVNFTARGEPVRVSLALPGQQEGFRLLREHTASSGYGLAYLGGDEGRRAEWTNREALGAQRLYYSAQMLVAADARDPAGAPPQVQESIWQEPYGTAAQAIVARAHGRSADTVSLAREIIRQFSDDEQGENARLILTQYDRPEALVRLLNEAGIGARVVHGLQLEDRRRQQTLQPWLEIHADGDWLLFEPATARQGRPDNLLLWGRDSRSVLEVEGGSNSQVRFSMIRHSVPATAMARDQFEDHGFLNFSIHALPLEEQALFQTLLLIPIGALVVVFLRIVVGVRTSGTFMPVLIALAFIQMSLLTGLIGFLLVVATGLLIRGYLSRLNLLLVARVSAVIITVIGIIAAFSVLAYQFGLNEALTITFFPIIILAWTIERMSILWEEEGPWEVLMQGGGSLVTAILAYLAMDNALIRYVTFNFIGLQFVVMALILLLGSYTGYRLLELRRFRPMVER